MRVVGRVRIVLVVHICAIGISLTLPAPKAQQASRSDATALAPQVDQLMARYMADATPVGVSVGLDRGDQVLVRGGWGDADREARKAATPETIYRLASTSKQFTAALVMRLVERGAVALDDPVDRHWPEMPPKWRGITVRQLLNHTSGVPDFQESGSGQWPKTFAPDKAAGPGRREESSFRACEQI